MKKTCYTLLFIFSGLIAATPSFAGHADAANCKDHPLLTRLPGYWIEAAR